jgi:hypothetical protein
MTRGTQARAAVTAIAILLDGFGDGLDDIAVLALGVPPLAHEPRQMS